MKFAAYNNSQNTWSQLLFSCEIAHNGKRLISVFQELPATINKTFILAGSLHTGLSFHGVSIRFPDISYFPKIRSR